MPYTRRDLILDAALISLTGATAGLPLAILPESDSKRGATSYNGVRIFFCGTWIFCSDGGTGMYAIARDIFDSNGMSTHIFPFGGWQQHNRPFDLSMPQLLPNPTNGDKRPVPYLMKPAGYTPDSSASIASLFADAQSKVPFTYLRNTDSALKFNLRQPGVIVISLPIPSRIRPDAHLIEATLQGDTSLLSPPSAAALENYKQEGAKGLPTAHIFEYDNATSLTFAAGSEPASTYTGTFDPASSVIDFHFHTVARNVMSTRDHGPMMFLNLLGLLQKNGIPLDENDLRLNDPCPTDIKSGFDPSIEFTAAELDYDSRHIESCQGLRVAYNLASCSGPGFGVDGDVGD